MSFENMISEDLIFLRENFKSANDVISFLSEQLKNYSYVNEGFLVAVLERESKFPTGLYLGDINVAIPHTDIKYAKKSGIAIARLNKPVNFRRMDNPDEEINVSLVFLLSVVDPKEYVNFLSKLTASFGDSSFVKKLYLAESKEDFSKSLKESLKEKAEVSK